MRHKDEKELSSLGLWIIVIVMTLLCNIAIYGLLGGVVG